MTKNRTHFIYATKSLTSVSISQYTHYSIYIAGNTNIRLTNYLPMLVTWPHFHCRTAATGAVFFLFSPKASGLQRTTRVPMLGIRCDIKSLYIWQLFIYLRCTTFYTVLLLPKKPAFWVLPLYPTVGAPSVWKGGGRAKTERGRLAMTARPRPDKWGHLVTPNSGIGNALGSEF